MSKTKLAICMGDLEYQDRFVNCFMNHYKHQYEMHVFTDMEELKMTNPLEYAVIITGEYTTEVIANFVERGEILLYLKDENLQEDIIQEGEEECFHHIIYGEKYQEVYKIADIIQRLVGDVGAVSVKENGVPEKELIGIFSLTDEVLQVPFAATLGNLYGEENKVLFIDLQSYSGLGIPEEAKDSVDEHLGMEDLLSVSMTGNYTKGRIMDCILHESNWDYVNPAKNTECLMEGTIETYEKMIDILGKELNYKKIIINFGTIFGGMLEFMSHCDQFYLLGRKSEIGKWREEAFYRELAQRGKKEFLHRITRIEMPVVQSMEGEWKKVAELWRWNAFGESMRQTICKEQTSGSVM